MNDLDPTQPSADMPTTGLRLKTTGEPLTVYLPGQMREYTARKVAEAVAAERERCAKLCDKQAADCATWDEGTQKDGGRVASHMCAEAIRKD